MKNKINYDELFEAIKRSNTDKSLLLHTCCAPCLTYPLSQIINYFDVSLYFYNPNITDEKEYKKRLNELKNFVSVNYRGIQVIEGEYNPSQFYQAAKGKESAKEGGERCAQCYRLRLKATAEKAKELGCDFFGTVLSVSPYKNTEVINSCGREIESQTGINFLYSDFKKRNGYKLSVQMSSQYGLYRQNYCGCVFSLQEREAKAQNLV